MNKNIVTLKLDDLWLEALKDFIDVEIFENETCAILSIVKAGN
jgi:hypothetical protein